MENEYDLPIADTSTTFRTRNNVGTAALNALAPINVFPNPFKDIVNITFTENKGVNKIEIYSITGSKMFELNNVNKNALQINTSDWNNGLYLIKISINNQTQIKKVNLIR